jgi:hypothetical protein
MKTNQKIVVFFGVCIVLLLGVFVFQYVSNSSGDTQAYFLEQDKKCKEAIAVGGLIDPETPTYVRADMGFFSMKLNTCILVIGVSSTATDDQGQIGNSTTIRVYDHTANNDLENMEIREFYPSRSQLVQVLEDKTKKFR